jgi:hypothetical protein
VDLDIHAQHLLKPTQLLPFVVHKVTRERGRERVDGQTGSSPSWATNMALSHDMFLLDFDGAIVVDLTKLKQIILVLDHMNEQIHHIGEHMEAPSSP